VTSFLKKLFGRQKPDKMWSCPLSVNSFRVEWNSTGVWGSLIQTAPGNLGG